MASEAPTSADGAAAKAADVPPVPLHSGAELLAACKSRDAVEVKRLLGVAGIDVNAEDENGWTPLHYACEKGHKELALALVANEADVNAKNKNDMTPLLYACEKGHKEVALALVANGADVNARDEEVVTQLLAAGAFHSGAELLACKNGEPDEAVPLLGIGADVNAKNKDGLTPLHYECAKGHKEVALALIANEADVNVKDKDGDPAALHVRDWPQGGGARAA